MRRYRRILRESGMESNKIDKTIDKANTDAKAWREETIPELIRIAIGDLESCEDSYNKGRYPQCVSSFQQSVEKALKSLALIFNPHITEEELKRKYGHDPLNVYEEFAQYQKKIYDDYNKNINKIPELKTKTIFKKINPKKDAGKLEKYIFQIRQIRKNRVELLHLSLKEIRSFIREINKVKKEFEKSKDEITNLKIPKRVLDEMKNELLKIFDVIVKYDPTAENVKNNLTEMDMEPFVEHILKPVLIPIINIFPIYSSLYYLAIVTLPHAIISRYPQKGIKPTKLYTNRLPIVKLMPTLIEIQKDVLNDLSSISSRTTSKR